MIKAFLSDMDGILLDSEAAHMKAFDYTIRKLKIKISKKDRQSVMGINSSYYVPKLAKKYNFDSKEFKEIEKKVFRKYFKTAPLFKPAINFLIKMKKQGYKVAIVTSSDFDVTQILLKRVKSLNGKIDKIVAKGDYKKAKPNPDPYLEGAKRLRVKPSECIALEDTQLGLTAAKRAKAKCIAIPTKLTQNQDFSKADLVVRSAKDICLDKIL